MCGIAGVIGLDHASGVAREDLERMGDALRHRGPDGAATWISARGDVGFAHRRLAIIDLDERAGQPMCDGSGRLTIVYNGEIYNHQVLRRALEAQGACFHTNHSDTEVLLEGYRAWGLDGLLARLDGMYAFALHDADQDKLVLVRDPIGIKPLYFTERGGALVFASEIKALLALPGLARRMDRSAAYHYLSFMVAPAPATLFEGIAKLPAGHLIEIGRDNVPKPRRFWSPADFVSAESRSPRPRAGDATFAGAAAEIRLLVEASVEKHMVADVPVGVFLSGGVDSTTLLALMRRASAGPVRSFTVGFRDDASLNETAEAREAARRHGAEHHEVLIDADIAEASLEAIVRHQDEPLADWVCIPLWHVAQLANQSSTKAILVGEGADELFLGYPSYQRFLALDARARALGRLMPGAVANAVARGADWLPPDRLGLRGLADHVHRSISGREAFWTGAIAYWETQKRAIMHRGANSAAPGWSAYGMRDPGIDMADSFAVIRRLLSEIDERRTMSQHSRMLTAELGLRLPELLLMRVDKMTMAHSLESRVPFLDRALVEHVLGLSVDQLIPDGRLKALLREAVRGLVPDDVLERPKKGFAAPMASWLRGPLGHRLETTVMASPALDEMRLDRGRIRRLFAAHRTSGKDLSLWLWPLINLSLWHRTWIAELRT